MDTFVQDTAKRLVAEYLNANPDYEPITDREQKAKLRKEIDQKRAQCDDFQRLISGLTIFNIGIRYGAENANTLGAISRESYDIVRSLIKKHHVELEGTAASTEPQRAAIEFLQAQYDKTIEEKMTEVIRCQEQQLTVLRRSRAFLMVEHAKEEALKAQQALEDTESAMVQLLENFDKEREEILQVFTELAIQIGEEQDRLDQNRAKLDACMRRREQLHETMDVVCAEPTGKLAVESVVGEKTPIPVANNEKEKDDGVGVVGLNFSNIAEDFPIGLTFKNPNDFPDILCRMNSPRDYVTMVQDIEQSSHKIDEIKATEGKRKDRKGLRRKTSVVEMQGGKIDFLPPSSPKKMKKMTNIVLQPQDLSTVQQPTEQHTVAFEKQKNTVNNSETIKRLGVRNKDDGSLCTNENLVPTVQQPEVAMANEKSLLTRSSPSLRELNVSLVDIQRTTQNINLPVDKTTPTAEPPSSTVAAEKQSRKKSPKVSGPIKQLSAQKQQAKQPPPVGAPKPQTSKKVCNLPTKRNTSPIRTNPKVRYSKRLHESENPVLQDPTGSNDGDRPEAMDADDSLLGPVQGSTSNGSLDYGILNSSNELDFNLSAELQDMKFSAGGGTDVDDLDFLLNTDPMAKPSAKEKRVPNTKAADNFDFDFAPQNSTDSMGQEVNDIF